MSGQNAHQTHMYMPVHHMNSTMPVQQHTVMPVHAMGLIVPQSQLQDLGFLKSVGNGLKSVGKAAVPIAKQAVVGTILRV